MKILIALIILFSAPISLVFADSAEADLLQKGIISFNLEKYEEAISYFDQILHINPENIDALNNKGGALYKQGKYIESLSYFDRVLKIVPDNKSAKNNLEVAKGKITYIEADGIIERTLRNSQGQLIAYQKITNIKILGYEYIDRINIDMPKKIITRNNQDFVIFQFTRVNIVNEDQVFGRALLLIPDIPIPIIAIHVPQVPVEKGDVITSVFTLFKPI